MPQVNGQGVLPRLASRYSMVIILLGLGAIFSWATFQEQPGEGPMAASLLADGIVRQFGPKVRVLIVVRETQDDMAYADALSTRLQEIGKPEVAVVRGQPPDARATLQEIADRGGHLDVIAANRATADWAVLHDLGRRFPFLGDVPVVTPPTYRWPTFLRTGNLLNIANQIAVIAILAIGMTMVIITGGIDLSVGSLTALSAVGATLLIRDLAGASEASASGMVLCCLAAVLGCTLIGLVSGIIITTFLVPPFIVTLAMMLVASGLSSVLANDESIYQLPDSFIWLGRGADFMHVPNAVVLMISLYLLAHVVMTRMTLGRYIYAVGGNAEAARLSGVPVARILLLAYAVSGALAGLGGVVLASQLKSGAPSYGVMYELYVIAAVVVGGTSLSGGEGRIFGTLVGAFLIAVIQNGMNLTGVRSNWQRVILGLVLLAAVLLDQLKKQTWRWRHLS